MAAGDHLTPTDLALETYKRALEPKRLVLFAGGHFDAYLKVEPAVGYRCPDMKTVRSEEAEPDGVGG